jgi:hypothetical protein
MTWPAKQLSFVLAILAACGGDDGSDGDDDDTGGSDSSSGTTMVFPTTDPDSGSSGVDPTLTTVTDSDTSSTDATITTTDPETSGDSSGSDTGTTDVCEPAKTDDECYACQKENCCDAMTMCVEADPNCACVLDCLAALEDPGPAEADSCAEECDADYLMIVPPLMMLAVCESEMCGGNNACGGGGN